MPPFSVLAPSRAGHIHLFGIHGYCLQIRADDEQIKLSSCGFSLSAFQNDYRFEYSRRRNEPSLCRRY